MAQHAMMPTLGRIDSKPVGDSFKERMRHIIGAYDSRIIRAYSYARFTIINVNILNILGLCLRGKQRILDIGCGFGLFGIYLAMQHPEITYRGIDLSRKRVLLARRAARRLGLKNVSFECADARELSLDDMFDGILMIDLLHHLDDSAKRALLSQSRSHLAPGGHLVVKDVLTRPFHKIAFTWLLDVLMTRSLDMWYMTESKFAEVLGDDTWRIENYAIQDLLPYPHTVYLCSRGSHAPAASV